FSVGSTAAGAGSSSTSPVSEHHPAAAKSFEEVATEKAQAVARHLLGLEESLKHVYETMKRLPDKCPADVFFDKIRPWVASWPDPGVVYATFCNCGFEEQRGGLLPEKYAGASGAQSSLLPSIDGFLGIAYG